VERIVITGHHPERFPGVPDAIGSWRYSAAMAVSKMFGLGDTFECYATYVGVKSDGPSQERVEHT